MPGGPESLNEYVQFRIIKEFCYLCIVQFVQWKDYFDMRYNRQTVRVAATRQMEQCRIFLLLSSLLIRTTGFELLRRLTGSLESLLVSSSTCYNSMNRDLA